LLLNRSRFITVLATLEAEFDWSWKIFDWTVVLFWWNCCKDPSFSSCWVLLMNSLLTW
jgi:hypothetical protein